MMKVLFEIGDSHNLAGVISLAAKILFAFIAVFLYPLIVVYNLTGPGAQFMAFINTHWTGAGIILCLLIISNTKPVKIPTRGDFNEIIDNLRIKRVEKDKPGFIYIMRREDGIYKIGKTGNTTRRLNQHTKSYGMDFALVKRFVVADADSYERLALQMTIDCNYREGNRQELRRMTDNQLDNFLYEFRSICQQGVDA